MREGKAGQQQKRPSLRKSTPWCPSKRGRKAPPTGCGGETAPSWGHWADCPPKAFPILSTDWVKSPHAGTWTGPHREERPLRGLSSPHLTCRPPPPPAPTTPEHLPKAERRWRESRGQNLGGRFHVLAQAARPCPGREDRSVTCGGATQTQSPLTSSPVTSVQSTHISP